MNNQIDSSIPVLTEIIYPSLDPQLQIEASSTPTSNTTTSISEEQWQTLEQSIRENVLRQVLGRIDFVLEHRVRDSLADVLQTAVESLALEIRSGLHKTMEEVITRALTQEITKAKMSK